ncbi:uncharacterized protein LOC143368913 isoform X2 [Andrena cerasifolii]|uniref:uncharacterized protein LOC143368913 isoform X2 n=1 Tax=Andrena cerasifolii TaxID=2819439 RepID=UPI0040383008
MSRFPLAIAQARRGDSSAMANASTMPLPRIDKTIPIYSPPDDAIVIHSSKHFDDIIEKIEGLRLRHDRKAGNCCGSLVNRFDRKTRESIDRGRSAVDCRSSFRDNDILRCQTTGSNGNENENENESDNDTDHDDDDSDTDSSSNSNRSSKHCYGNNDSRVREEQLIERGPIKSHFPSTTRAPPYWMTYGQPQDLKTNETFTFDYDKTAEQILRDKEYSEKLNACLDQLQDAARTVCNAWTNSKDQSTIKSCSLDNDVASVSAPAPALASTANEPSEDSLLEILTRGCVQPAQSVSESRLLYSPDTTRTWHDSRAVDGRDPAASESESGGSSSPNSSACPSTRAEFPPTRRSNNLTCSPIGSPRVAATKYRPPQRLSSSSNSSFSFSSSSNQSYSDSPSPNPMHQQVPLGSQMGEQLDEDLENFSLWSDTREPLQNVGLNICEIDEENKAARDATAASNILDTIDKNDLQLVDEILKTLGEEKPEAETIWSKSERTANLLSYVNESTCQEALRANLLAEQYLTRFDLANSTTRPTRDKISAEHVAGTDLSESNVSYQARENSIGSRIPNLEIANPIPTDYKADAIVPNYYNGDVSRGVVEGNHWQTQAKAVGTDSDTVRSIFQFLHSNLHAPSFPSSTVIDTALTSHINFHESRPTESTNPTDPIEIPNVFLAPWCSGSSSSKQQLSTTNSDRSIMPWPSLNLPLVRASERLKDGLNAKEVERAMSSLLKRSVEELAKQDEDGDTMLMCLVGNPDELAKKKAYLAPLVERLSAVKKALSVSNDRGEDALYLAALNCPQYPYVTGYLAAAMLQKGLDVSQRLYHTRDGQPFTWR